MFKAALSAFLITIIPLLVVGQTAIGVQGGVGYSSINGIGSTQGNYSWKGGLVMGLFSETSIGENLYLKPGLLYNMRGYGYDRVYPKDKVISGDTLLLNNSTQLGYLDIPILAKVKLGKFYLEAGPQFGLLLKASSQADYLLQRNGSEKNVRVSKDIIERVEPLDIGFIAGAGYNPVKRLGISIRVNQGFREVMRRVNWQKNVSLQTSISYTFSDFKKRSNGPVAWTPSNKKSQSRSKQKSEQTGYKVTSKQNIQRISIVKVAEATNSQVQFVFNSVGGHTPSSLLISGSSGTEEQSALFTGFRDIQTPFKGLIRFKAQSSIGTGTIETNLEYEIYEPGIWKVMILVQ